MHYCSGCMEETANKRPQRARTRNSQITRDQQQPANRRAAADAPLQARKSSNTAIDANRASAATDEVLPPSPGPSYSTVVTKAVLHQPATVRLPQRAPKKGKDKENILHQTQTGLLAHTQFSSSLKKNDLRAPLEARGPLLKSGSDRCGGIPKSCEGLPRQMSGLLRTLSLSLLQRRTQGRATGSSRRKALTITPHTTITQVVQTLL